MLWRIRPRNEQAARALEGDTKMGPLLCGVLAARGIADARQAEKFFRGDDIESPFALLDMDKAAMRISQAIQDGEKIAVFGDYDVDGVTAAATMYIYLEASGAYVTVELPVRDGDGYGLSQDVIGRFAQSGVTLLVTVDNGIAAFAEVQYASSLGIDTVICDHHIPPDKLPPAVAVVDPLREGDNSAFKDLSGVGVALKLVSAVEGCEVEELFDMFGGFAAIGTIADIMPLVGENRRIVCEGISRLRDADNIGLAALCEAAGIEIAALDSRKIAFGIAPRLNAAGRMGDAYESFSLLVTDDPDEAQRLALHLNDQNIERQQTERGIADMIEERISREPSIAEQPVIVVDGENYHSGVIGIVASRLVEKYDRPAIVLTVENGECKGSGRSLKGFSLFDALSYCSQLLVKFGGHELAAGLSIKPENIGALRQRLNEYCEKIEMPTRELEIDCVVCASELTLQSVAELARLEPFGNKNDSPVFAVENALIKDLKPLSDGRHTRITLSLSDGEISLAMFSVSPEEFPFKVGARVDAAFSSSIRDGKWLSLQALSVMPSGFVSVSRYLAFSRGESADVSDIAPSRPDVAAVYRAIQKRAYSVDDPYSIAADSGVCAGKALACAEILCQLSLAEVDGKKQFRTLDGAEKTSLEMSSIFNTLNGK